MNRLSQDSLYLLNQIYRLSYKDLSLNDLLKYQLKMIVSVSFFSDIEKASIFLTENKESHLALGSHYNLQDNKQFECAIIPLGTCHRDKLVIQNKLNEPDYCDKNTLGIKIECANSCSHYCIPIFSKKSLLGILNFIRNTQSKKSKQEILFLKTLSKTLGHIIEQKLEIKNINNINNRFEETLKIKDKFIALVAHDLKNPLNGIKGYFQLIQYEENISETIKNITEDAVSACEEMQFLIKEILNLCRIKKGKITPRYSYFNIYPVINQIIKNHATDAHRKKINIKNTVPEFFFIYFDKLLFTEILNNLISNSIKFCNESGVIRFFLPDKDRPAIAISDTGVGIEEKRMETIFKYDENSSTLGTMGEKGTGFGLPLVKEIVQAHNADISVSSNQNQGTVFSINYQNITPRILVINENIENLTSIKSAISKLKADYIEASDIQTAEQLLVNKKPHVILLDLLMSNQAGLEVLEFIKSKTEQYDIPVIAIMADNQIETRDIVLHHSLDDFVPNPLDMYDIIHKIEKSLSNAYQEGELFNDWS
ncbi:MAG: ATP-binding protein [Spirochaetia bacterium]|nr:ATP-binding protein [Spirochaetia bacterium]